MKALKNKLRYSDKPVYLLLQLMFMFAAFSLLAIEGRELTTLNQQVILASIGISILTLLGAIWVMTYTIVLYPDTQTTHDHYLVKSAWWYLATFALLAIILQNVRSFDEFIEVAKLINPVQQLVALLATLTYIESLVFASLYTYKTYLRP